MSLAAMKDSGSSLDKKWILCMVASIIGCIFLTVCLDYSDVVGLQFWTLGTSSAKSIAFSNQANNLIPAAGALQPSNSSDQSGVTIGNQRVKKRKGCNIFEGHWVPDQVSPMYHGDQCPFISDQVSCRKNGRPDSDYERWSWEGKGCEIPRFNGTDMLERLRGKRLILAGDSLNRNQWESLACLLYSSINNSSGTYVDVQSDVYKLFRAQDYNCSVEFHWSPFLVQHGNATDDGKQVVRLDKIIETAEQWKGADIMVFNTGSWWVHRGKMKSWDLFEYKGKFETNMEVASALELALKTWSEWIRRNVDVSKTKVFFRSISPQHYMKKYRCNNQTDLIKDGSYVLDFPKTILNVIEERIRKMGTQVNYLNITKLSQYRKDGHPSIYALTEEQKMAMGYNFYSDCSHWCLPGLPDTWNKLLYASLFFNSTSLLIG